MSNELQDIVAKLRDLIKQLEMHETTLTNDTKSKKRGIILAPNNIINIDKLVTCCCDDIVVYIYDINWTFSQFMTNLSQTLTVVDKCSLDVFAWVFHGDMSNFRIVSDFPVNVQQHYNIAQWQHFIDIIMQIIPYMKPDFERIDFMGCSLMNNPDFYVFKPLLEYTTNTTCATSSNNTGNVNGADWILEDGNVNLMNVYFKPDTEQILKDYPIELNFINNNLIKDFTRGVRSFAEDFALMVNDPQTYFDGKSPIEISMMVFDIAAFMPGPVGFVSGLVSFGLSAAKYAEKIRKKEVTVLDHIDFAMGALGTLASCMPGGRMASKMVGKTVSKVTCKIVPKLTGVGSKLLVKIGDVRAIRSMTSNVRQAMETNETFVYVNYKIKFLSVGKSKIVNGLKQVTCVLPDCVDIYNKFCAIETLLDRHAPGFEITMFDQEDSEMKLSPSRQGLIEIYSKLATSSSCKDRTSEFAQILAINYGTATINGTDLYAGQIDPPAIGGIFIDNEMKLINDEIKTIKLNPRTIAYIYSDVGDWSFPTTTDIFINEDSLLVKMCKVNRPRGVWRVSTVALDNMGAATIHNVWNGSTEVARSIVVKHFGISKIVLKPKTVAVVTCDNNQKFHFVNKDATNDLAIPIWLGGFQNTFVYDYKEDMSNGMVNNVSKVVLTYNDGQTRVLNFDEIMVFDETHKCISQNSKCAMSSVYYGAVAQLGPQNAIDSKVNVLAGDCVLTSNEVMPWFEMNVNGSYRVRNITLTNKLKPPIESDQDVHKRRLVGSRIILFKTVNNVDIVVWASDVLDIIQDKYQFLIPY